jgi:hypothetical protein
MELLMATKTHATDGIAMLSLVMVPYHHLTYLGIAVCLLSAVRCLLSAVCCLLSAVCFSLLC